MSWSHCLASSELALDRTSGFVVAAAVLIFTAGCGGGNRYAVDKGRISTRTYSTEKSVPHPDSLNDVFIAKRRSGEDRDSIGLKKGVDLQSLMEKWSSAAGPPQYYGRQSHFATLYSKELALAQMARRAEATSSPDSGAASRRTAASSDSTSAIEDQIESYRKSICIDVYLFASAGTPFIDAPSTVIKLRVGDRVLYPTEQEYGPLRLTYLPRGETTYRRLTLVFPRIVEGTDVLRRSSRIDLESYKTQFSWTWKKGDRRAAAERSLVPKGR